MTVCAIIYVYILICIVNVFNKNFLYSFHYLFKTQTGSLQKKFSKIKIKIKKRKEKIERKKIYIKKTWNGIMTEKKCTYNLPFRDR